ncbi:MAG: tetratricopeptide repeat protein [Treponema sp.]|jgi:tetratricopeptide (TPR) repeat protein|nr:tetratricopeptide repeat protein [Treponema sp.]
MTDKKKNRGIVTGIAVLCVIAAAVVGLYTYQESRTRNDLAKRIVELGKGGPPVSMDDLREAIGLYEKQIEQHVKDAAQTGVYWKILGTRFQERGLYSQALDAFEHALSFTPEDHSIHYMSGLCAAIVGKSRYDNPVEQDRYFDLAEHAYERAMEIAPDYSRPRYSIAVLYVYELARPEDAIPHLMRYLELSRNNVDGMLLLAAAYYMTGNDNAALELCDRIPSVTKDKGKIAEAAQFKMSVLNSRYQ